MKTIGTLKGLLVWAANAKPEETVVYHIGILGDATQICRTALAYLLLNWFSAAPFETRDRNGPCPFVSFA